MRNWRAISWFSSMLTLTNFTAPLASATAFSSAGPSCLQGPHQGAQKSTMTGTWREASSTSAAKVSRLPSLMCGLPVAAAGGWSADFGAETGRPVGPINAMELAFSYPDRKMGVGGRKEKALPLRQRETGLDGVARSRHHSTLEPRERACRHSVTL